MQYFLLELSNLQQIKFGVLEGVLEGKQEETKVVSFLQQGGKST